MIILTLILSVVLGVGLGYRFAAQQKLAKNLLILSAGFLITVCLTEVFPEVYESGQESIGYWVIGGVLLQLLLENLTKGFEHGHFHHRLETNILPAALMIGLFVHAFIEGIPLANETDVRSPYLLGIVFHNIPISFILGSFLASNKRYSTSALIIVAIFALASPAGVLLGQFFDTELEPIFLAVVGGIFLHISSVIIFESSKNHKIDWRKIFLVLAGVLLAVFGHAFHQH